MARDKLISWRWLTCESVARMSLAIRTRRRTVSERAAEHRRLRTHSACPAIESIRKVGNELRLAVVSSLIQGPLRFSGILDAASGLDPKSLSRVLKYLASEGIVRRDVLSTQPVAVQYSLTEKGRQLESVVEALRVWGERWIVPQEVVPSSPARLSH